MQKYLLFLHKDDPRKVMGGKILLVFSNKNSQEVQHGAPENYKWEELTRTENTWPPLHEEKYCQEQRDG